MKGWTEYLPLAALHDGTQYLIEQYRISVMTLGSNTRLLERSDPEWRAAGFGVTKAYEDQPALPSVMAELAGIIATKPGDAGVMVGEVKLDGERTTHRWRSHILSTILRGSAKHLGCSSGQQDGKSNRHACEVRRTLGGRPTWCSILESMI